VKRTAAQASESDEKENARLVGEFLRNRREGQGLTPEQVGVAIRVGVRQILAVEEGRFADLPPQPYGRGLVSAYATLLGVEPEQLLRACGPALAGESSGEPRRIFQYPAGEKFIWREWSVPFALALVVAAIVIARTALTPAPVELAVPVAATAPAAPPRPVQPVDSMAPAPVEGAHAEPAPLAAPGVRVTLRCGGTTWAEAAADGAEPRRYELGPGQSLELTARERLTLSLGDAGVVRLTYNDRELGYIGFKGQAKTGLLFPAAKALPATPPPAATGD
jgi:cytoskeleton protein RodZ